ncbi:uncharacterized protein LOC135391370 [Ornithodoros turicata]|uniref:uncharacterized protein LOC135391370 n=1 Tax=Ornithodoros turicata TaxID=34597 RepID=UPI003139C240
MQPPAKRHSFEPSGRPHKHGRPFPATTRSSTTAGSSKKGRHKERPSKSEGQPKSEGIAPVDEEPKPPQQQTPQALKRSPPKIQFILGGCMIALLLAAALTLWYTGALSNIFKSKEESCMSIECKKADSIFHMMLNESVSPCHDFFEYTCGGRHLEEDQEMIMVTSEALAAVNSTFYKYKLEDADKHHLRNAIMLYRSCRGFQSEAQQFVRVLQRNVFRSLGLSPTTQSSDSLEVFHDVIHMSLDKGFDTLLSINFVAYEDGVKIRIAPGVSLYSRLLVRDEDIQSRKYFNAYLRDFMAAINANRFRPEVQDSVLDLDDTFHESVDYLKSDSGESKIVSVSELPTTTKMTVHDWVKTINSSIGITRRKLTIDSTVGLYNPEAIEQVIKFIFSNDPKLTSLYLLVQASAIVLQFHFLFRVMPQRTCILLVVKYFPSGFVTLLANEYIGQSRNEHFRSFFEHLREEIIESLAASKLFDEITREAAIVVLKDVKLRTIAPDTEGLLLDAPRMTSNFVDNVVAMTTYFRRRENRYPKGEDYEYSFLLFRSLHLLSVARSAPGNKIIVPITMMAPPNYYDVDKDTFINYSPLGATLAGLIMEAIVDAWNDQVPSWWSQQSRTAFDEGLTCYGDQFFLLTNGSVPNVLKKRLFTAVYGISLALALAHLPDQKAKQLFFGRYCQMHCRSGRGHHYGRSLCHIAVQNIPLFFETFKCGSNDAMRPERICAVK